jgi:hypothetical protein
VAHLLTDRGYPALSAVAAAKKTTVTSSNIGDNEDEEAAVETDTTETTPKKDVAEEDDADDSSVLASFKYLTSMNLRQLTQRKMDQLQQAAAQLQAQLDALASTSPQDVWRQDIDEFMDVFTDHVQSMTEAYTSAGALAISKTTPLALNTSATAVSTGAAKAAKPKRVRKAPATPRAKPAKKAAPAAATPAKVAKVTKPAKVAKAKSAAGTAAEPKKRTAKASTVKQ